MKKIRIGVVGVGHLGKFHAEKYAGMTDVELVGVADTDKARADKIARRFGAQSCHSHAELLDSVDAVSIAAPTPAHFHVGRDFLRHGAHLFIEKPIATTADEAMELIEMAAAKGLIIQVGHIERFNPVIVGLKKIKDNPFLFEAKRFSPFKERAANVSVILDLMIHDIDIALSLADSPTKKIHASGASAVTDHIDIAYARIEFKNGLVANLAASRIAEKECRKMKIFQKNGYISIDFASREMAVFRPASCDAALQTEHSETIIPGMDMEQFSFKQGDALKEELKSFVDAISLDKTPEVTGQMGLNALEIALNITKQISRGEKNVRGPE